MDKVNYGLYLVTDTNICPREKLLSVTESAIKGGVTLVQLREKDISTREFFAEASELKKLCKHYDVPLLINDRIDIALAVDADGIHIGQSDMPLKVSRRILGSNKIIGLSAGNVNQAELRRLMMEPIILELVRFSQRQPKRTLQMWELTC